MTDGNKLKRSDKKGTCLEGKSAYEEMLIALKLVKGLHDHPYKENPQWRVTLDSMAYRQVSEAIERAELSVIPIKWTEDNIKVYPIDTDAIVAEVNKACPLAGEAGGKRYYFHRGKMGVILSPKLAYIDDECCGTDIEEDTIVLQWYEKEDISKQEWTVCPIPTLESHFTLKELETFLCNPIRLKTFMGERYNYNRRIDSNLYNWLSHFNS